jgi:hypothetical protein
MKNAILGAVVGLFAGAAAVATAQVMVAPQREPPPPVVAAPASPAGSLVLAALDANTAIAVKDHGEYQTVFLYSRGADGRLEPTPQKMKYFYK